MASIIRIKRSSTQGNPGTLGSGELAYSSLTGTQINGGDRIFIGVGTETAGDASSHHVIGGKYFTDMLDHVHGTVTADSALIVDSSSKLDILNVDNLTLNGNDISSTNSNGNITINPNGTGYVSIVGTNGLVIPVGTTVQQGPAVAGAIRLNSDSTQFEGYSGTNWSSLGGVRSVDGLTYILAEATPASSDDTLHFYAATGASTNAEVATMNATKLAILQTTAATSTTTGALTVAGGASVVGNLYVGGNLVLTGTETAINSVTFQNGLTLSGSATPATEYFTINDGTTTKFQVDSASGNTNIVGTLSVTGHTTMEGVTSTGATGTGKHVYDTSPTLITPVLGVASATTINKVTITAPTSSATLTLVDGSSLITSGAFATTLTATATTNVTLPTTGTLATLAGSETFTNKTLTTPTIAIINGSTASSGTLTLRSTSSVSKATAGILMDEAIASTSTTTGTLKITGGLGVSGNIYAGNFKSDTSVTITAGSTNTNINLVPNGTGTVDVASKRITSVATPTTDTDAANKGYVDAVKTGLNVKDSARIASTTALTVTYSNGSSGVGATLTNAGTLAALNLDSVPAVVGDRVLIKDQAAALQNGIYTVTNIGSGAVAWTLTRATDFDNNPTGEVGGGDFVFVQEGTTQGDNGYVVTSNGVITVGTSTIDFVQFSGAGQITAGAGLTKSGNTIDAVGTSNRILVNADSIDIASTYVGQSSITTLGTIATGTWQGTVIAGQYGGTGVANTGKTITLGGNLTTSGAFATTLTATATTSVTLPTTGTLATLAGTETLTNKTLTTPVIASITSPTVSFPSGTASTNTTSGAVVVTGGVGISGSINVGVNITGAGAATSTLDGFQIDGGTY